MTESTSPEQKTNKNDIAVGLNTAFNEIIWYYPSANAKQIDRAVA